MVLPRRFFLGQSRAVSRRTHGQECRFTPSPAINARVRYLLIWACHRYAEAVDVSAYCALSNHHHLVVLDKRGGADSKVSDLFRDLHAAMGKTVNYLQERSGILWDANTSFSDVEIHGYEAEIAQWVYVAGQAVAAGLVERPEDWPGVCWLPEDVGTVWEAERPDVLYSTRPLDDLDEEELAEAQERLRLQLERRSEEDRARGRSPRRRRQLMRERLNRGQAKLAPPPPPKPKSSLPERVSYRIPPPKCLQDVPIERAREILREALDLYVAKLHEERREQGKGFVGADRVRDQDPHSPPPGTSVADDEPAKYQRVPRLATKGLHPDEVRELKDGLIRFFEEHRQGVDTLYREAKPYRAVFPEGTHLRARELRRVRAAYYAHAPPRAA